jgi:hypothetical protein
MKCMYVSSSTYARELLDRHMKLLTIETESSLGTLWDQEQCTQFCSKEGAPAPEEQYQERFWRRRLDGIGLDTVNDQ